MKPGSTAFPHEELSVCETPEVTLGQDEEERFKQRQASDTGKPVIKGYELQRVLGSGAFGQVWAARQERSGQMVALKVIHPGVDKRILEREVSRIREVTEHPHVVSLLDADILHEPPYFVMPILAGSLAEVSRPSIKQALDWLAQAADGLLFTHDRGLLHCDLKPSNILVDSQSRLRLVDFGQALAGGGQTALGTLGFMAPEQGLGQASVRSDLYSLGATFYRILGGRYPRIESQQLEELAQLPLAEALTEYNRLLFQQPLIPLQQLNHSLDRELASIVEATLVLDCSQRTASAAILLEDLQRRQVGTPLLCRRPWSLAYRCERWLRRPVVAVSLLSLAILLGLANWSYQRLSQAHRALKMSWTRSLAERGATASLESRQTECMLWSAAALQLDPNNSELRLRLATHSAWTPIWSQPLLSSLRFSHHGKWLLAEGAAKSVWDSSRGIQIAKFSEWVEKGHFSPDDRHLALVHPDSIELIQTGTWSSVQSWDLQKPTDLAWRNPQELFVVQENGRLLKVNVHSGRVSVLAKLPPQGRTYFLAQAERFLLWSPRGLSIYDTKLGRQKPPFGPPLTSPDQVSVCPEGRWVLASEHLYDLTQEMEVVPPWRQLCISQPFLGPKNLAAVRLKAPSGRSSEIHIYDLSQNKLLFARPTTSDSAPLFSPDGRYLWLPEETGRLRGYALPSGQLCADNPLLKRVSTGTFSPDGQLLVGQNFPRGLNTYRPPQSLSPTKEYLAEECLLLHDSRWGRLQGGQSHLQLGKQTPSRLDYPLDTAQEGGEWLALSGPNGSYLMNARSGVLQAYPQQRLYLRSDGEYSVLLTFDKNEIRLGRPGEERRLPLDNCVIIWATFDPDSDRLALLADTSRVYLLDARDGRRLLDFPVAQGSRAIEFGRQDTLLVLARDQLHSYRANQGRAIRPPRLLSLPGHYPWPLPGSKRTLLVEQSQLEVIDNSTGQSIFPAFFHQAEVICWATSQNGDWLASADREGSVRLWSLTTGWPLTPWLHHDQPVTAVTISLDRRWLICASGRYLYHYRLNPVIGDPTDVKHKAEASTGFRLDPETGSVSPLSEVE